MHLYYSWYIAAAVAVVLYRTYVDVLLSSVQSVPSSYLEWVISYQYVPEV